MRTRAVAGVGLLLLLAGGGSSAQDWARAELGQSPRHHEWVAVKYDGRAVRTFVVYPESKEKTAAIIVIHENQGLTDWVRTVADQLAAAGYIAVAPDLLSGMGPKGGGTESFADGSAAREAISKLQRETVTADLNAVADYAAKLPASTGQIAVAGFCWGGAQTFRFATSRKDLAAAFVFYGTGPEEVSGIETPVYGFYGGNDARVNATIPKSEELMQQAGKKYEPVIYDGAGHGFMRSGQAPDASEANQRAREQAWERWLELLQAM